MKPWHTVRDNYVPELRSRDLERVYSIIAGSRDEDVEDYALPFLSYPTSDENEQSYVNCSMSRSSFTWPRRNQSHRIRMTLCN